MSSCVDGARLQLRLATIGRRPSEERLPAVWRKLQRTMQRKVISEMLDQDLGTPAEVASSLTDLRHINDWFGGTRTTIALLRRIAAEGNCRRLSLLEVAAGTGDVPLAAQRALAGDGTE